MASSRPAQKLASSGQRTFDARVAPVAMHQYPAAALCTEFENRVGEISRPARASAWHNSWQLWPSPPEEENTLASPAGSIFARDEASSATASASFTTRPVRRRSVGGRVAGAGRTVAPGGQGLGP